MNNHLGRPLCMKCMSLGILLHSDNDHDYCDCERGIERKKREATLSWKLWNIFIRPPQQLFWRVFHWLNKLPQDIKAFYQRGRYGLADRDTWNFEQHMATVIIDGCLKLMSSKHGVAQDFIEKYPMDENYNVSQEDFEKAVEDQNAVLYDIANCFACLESLGEMGTWDGHKFTPYTEERTKFYQSEIDRGFDLLKKYHHILWD